MWKPEKSSVWSFTTLDVSAVSPRSIYEFMSLQGCQTCRNGLFMVLDDPVNSNINVERASVFTMRVLCSGFGIGYVSYTTDSSMVREPELYFTKII